MAKDMLWVAQAVADLFREVVSPEGDTEGPSLRLIKYIQDNGGEVEGEESLSDGEHVIRVKVKLSYEEVDDEGEAEM